jgi:hypothetical protein
MSQSAGNLLAAVVVGALLFALATPAVAAETSNSEFVIIPEGDVFPDDLYAGAIRVVVEGTLEGDLIAFAAEQVVINGIVTGSVTAVTPSVTVNGEIGESLRVTGNRLTVTGEVGEDVVAAVVDATLSSSSVVGGDVILWAWNATALGSVGGDLTGSQRNLEVAGQIDGDLDVSVSRLAIVDDLSISGDLGYRSDVEARGVDQVTVGGTIVNKTPLPPNLRVRALGLLGRFLVVVVLSVAALSVAYGWPRRTSRAVAEVGNTPIRNWLTGALILLSPVIATVVTGLILGLAPAAAAFPLLVVLVPVILALVGIAFALALVAGGPTAGWLGGAIFKRFDLYGSILVGSLMAGAVWYLPWVGWLVPIVILPLGLGAWIATWRGQSPDSPGSNERMASSTA